MGRCCLVNRCAALRLVCQRRTLHGLLRTLILVPFAGVYPVRADLATLLDGASDKRLTLALLPSFKGRARLARSLATAEGRP
jgi:hypothetical protein